MGDFVFRRNQMNFKRPRIGETKSCPRFSAERCATYIVEIDEDRVVTYVNQAAFSSLGIEEGCTLEENPRVNAEAFIAAFKRLRTLEVSTLSFEMILDSTTTLIASMESLFEGENSFKGAVLFIINAPSQYMPCEENAELKSVILDAMPQAVVAANPANKILVWNHAATRMYGYSANEMIGQDCSRLFSIQSPTISKRLATGTHYRGENIIRSRIGRRFRARASLSALRSHVGAHLGTLGVYDEVTRPEEDATDSTPASIVIDANSLRFPTLEPNADNAMREGFTKAIGDVGPCATVLIDKERHLTWADEWYSKLTGIDMQEAKGKPAVTYLCGKCDDVNVIATLNEALQNGQSLGIVIPQSSSARCSFLTLELNVFHDPSGGISHFVAKLRDVDYRQKSDSTDVALSKRLRLEFFNTLSHELKTPLNGIIGATTMLLRSSLLDPAETKKNLELILCCAEMLSTLINNLIDYRKIEANQLDLLDSPFDLRVSLGQAIGCCEPLAAQKKLRVRVEISPELPACVVGDAGRINQIVTNILTNAIKYTPPARDIHIAVSASQPTTSNTRTMELLFKISDTGIGVPPERLQSLFSDAPLVLETGKQSGPGLGLRICKKLVERMQGRIWAESKVGHGSTFFFKVAVKLPTLLQRSSVVDHSTSPDMKILIVEDNLLNQKVLSRILAQLGHRADIASNGREAIEQLTRNSYDLILMDIAMPIMNGLEATRYIVEHWDAPNRPIIVGVTANAVTADINEYINAGMKECVMKPVTVGKIIQILSKVAKEGMPSSTGRRSSY